MESLRFKIKLSEIKKLYEKKDKMHNWNHIIRLRKNVKLINYFEHVDKKLLNFLINFHGLKEYVKINKRQFPREYAQSLLRHNKNPKTPEEKLVHDANLLDNLGMQGIKKALYIGGTKKRSEDETYNFIRQEIKKAKFCTFKGKEIGKKQIEIMFRKLK